MEDMWDGIALCRWRQRGGRAGLVDGGKLGVVMMMLVVRELAVKLSLLLLLLLLLLLS